MKWYRPIVRLLASVLFVISVAGCALSSGSQVRHPGQGGSFHEEGLASWYGPGFHGRKTASGERFNQNAMTCAHKTLPFGTKLKVINLDNGQELVVTVNDRGPFVRSRIVDLSREGAKKLGFIHQGTTRVRIERHLETYALETE